MLVDTQIPQKVNIQQETQVLNSSLDLAGTPIHRIYLITKELLILQACSSFLKVEFVLLLFNE